MTEEEKEEEVTISDLMKDTVDYKDKYFRALAEMENTRKRLQHEKQEMVSYAVGNMLAEFLIPLDNLDNALRYTDNLSSELKTWAQGFKMIAAQFAAVLDNHGIVPFDSLGKKFDPHFHEAVETIETGEHEDGTIIEEIQKGYRHGDRILRVSKVRVYQKPKNHNINREEKMYDKKEK